MYWFRNGVGSEADGVVTRGVDPLPMGMRSRANCVVVCWILLRVARWKTYPLEPFEHSDEGIRGMESESAAWACACFAVAFPRPPLRFYRGEGGVRRVPAASMRGARW